VWLLAEVWLLLANTKLPKVNLYLPVSWQAGWANIKPASVNL
jgi:hypothetical protein